MGGPTDRVALAIHPRLLTGALEETANQADVELREHWDLVDPHISALVTETTADLGDGSPAGTIYGEALANELFKQSTGRSPHNYVVLQRIELAKQLLRDPKRSIIETGLDLGFQNPSHFARMFRKLERVTPSQFRADYLTKPLVNSSFRTGGIV